MLRSAARITERVRTGILGTLPAAHRDGHPGPTRREKRERRLVRSAGKSRKRKSTIKALLRIPVFYKLLISNVLILGIAVSISVWGTAAYVRSESGGHQPGLWIGVGLGLVMVTVLANGFLVRLALSPLDHLERTARAVTSGGTVPRAILSPFADRRFEALVRSFNTMLDRIELHRERLRRLVARCRTGQVEERRKISRELRNDAAQRLAAALLQLEMVQRQAGADPVVQGLELVKARLEEAVASLGQVVRELRASDLEDLGLAPAIRAEAREVEERSGVPVTVDRCPDRDETRWLPADAEVAAYGIVQEALDNVARHSGATRARIVFDTREDALQIVVTDDGRGFDPARAPARRGEALGLLGMEEWATSVGGRLRIDSEPGRGTCLTFVLQRAEGAAPAEERGGE